MVAHIFNSNTWEAKTGRSFRLNDRASSRTVREILSREKKKKKEKGKGKGKGKGMEKEKEKERKRKEKREKKKIPSS